MPIIAMNDTVVPVNRKNQNTPTNEKKMPVMIAVGARIDSNSAAITM